MLNEVPGCSAWRLDRDGLFIAEAYHSALSWLEGAGPNQGSSSWFSSIYFVLHPKINCTTGVMNSVAIGARAVGRFNRLL